MEFLGEQLIVNYRSEKHYIHTGLKLSSYDSLCCNFQNVGGNGVNISA